MQMVNIAVIVIYVCLFNGTSSVYASVCPDDRVLATWQVVMTGLSVHCIAAGTVLLCVGRACIAQCA
jgi:hypothetical protein